MGDNEENSAPPESPESPLPPPKSAASASLVEHIRVNSIGDYYGVDSLTSLANSKIQHLLRASKDPSWITALPSAIEAAVGSTGDDELLGILASAIAANISALLELDQFKSLHVMTDFSIKVLQSCAERLRTMEEGFGHDIAVLTQKNESRVSTLEGSLRGLISMSRCRNCRQTSDLFTNPVYGIFRCGCGA